MTTEQLVEAVHQMITRCQLYMTQYKTGQGPYRSVSARGVLRELEFSDADAQDVLLHIAAGGFDYCLDHTIPMTGHHDLAGKTPPLSVCYWGADQLESRLQSLRNVPRLYA